VKSEQSEFHCAYLLAHRAAGQYLFSAYPPPTHPAESAICDKLAKKQVSGVVGF